MKQITDFYLWLEPSDILPIKHLAVLFFIDKYMIKINFTWSGIYFFYEERSVEDCMDIIKVTRRETLKIRLLPIFSCVSLAKNILNIDNLILTPTKFYRRFKDA